jgi:hypothetical protein
MCGGGLRDYLERRGAAAGRRILVLAGDRLGGRGVGHGGRLVVRLVSSPLFWFLLLRWLWRHAVWGLLLRDLARLELSLVATHPDGAGGLAFIGHYPNAFAAFVFALSCVLGAAIARRLLHGEMTPTTYGQLMAAWLVVVVILFGAPLLAFGKPLWRLKDATVLAAGAVATRRQRALERDLLGSNMAAAADAEPSAAADISDASKLDAAARKLSIFLISRLDRAARCRRAAAAGVVSRMVCKRDHGFAVVGPCGQRAALSTGQVVLVQAAMRRGLSLAPAKLQNPRRKGQSGTRRDVAARFSRPVLSTAQPPIRAKTIRWCRRRRW